MKIIPTKWHCLQSWLILIQWFCCLVSCNQHGPWYVFLIIDWHPYSSTKDFLNLLEMVGCKNYYELFFALKKSYCCTQNMYAQILFWLSDRWENQWHYKKEQLLSIEHQLYGLQVQSWVSHACFSLMQPFCRVLLGTTKDLQSMVMNVQKSTVRLTFLVLICCFLCVVPWTTH